MSDNNEQKREIIENYIRAYNDFDVENMLRDMDDALVFRNISGGAVNLETSGIDEFRAQAEQAATLFSRREQKITSLEFGDAEAQAEIDYRGMLAADLPNGLKAGDEIVLRGKSIFRFSADGKIIELEDVS